MIVRKLLDPSRPDAFRLTRNQKMAMLHFMYAVTTLEDLSQDIGDRLEMIPDGMNRMKAVAEEADRLLSEIRVTVPENQRIGIQNIADDYEMRLAPKATPGPTNVLITRNEFKELVEAARAKCKECILDDNECEGCELYRLLTSVLPMDDYHSLNLCPYNLGEWMN